MTDSDNRLVSEDEFLELEDDFESFLKQDEAVVDAPQSDMPSEGIPVVPAPIQEQIEASGSLKKSKKIIPPGRSGLRNRIIRKILKRAGKTSIPPVDDFFKNKVGTWVKINEIALFTTQPKDELLAELVLESCPNWNRINCADILTNRMVEVGSQILRDKVMYTPIHVARVEDGSLECISGRHRLAFFVLVYGGECQVPIYLESMTLGEARHAVAVANDSRPMKALEHAEHAALSAVDGDAAAEQEELYRKIARNKNGIKKYCVYSIVKRKYPTELDFGASAVPCLMGDDITTISNLESYWGASLEWNKEMVREDFDAALMESTSYLNRLSHAFRSLEGFIPKRHMSSSVLTAVGRYYKMYANANGVDTIAGVDTLGDDYINKIAVIVVTMESIEEKDAEEIYVKLVEVFTRP